MLIWCSIIIHYHWYECIESWTCNPKVMGSSLRSGRDCRWGEWMSSALSTLNTMTPGTKPTTAPQAPQLKCLPTAPGVYVFVHLDGLNAEHKFRVWVTILGHTSRPVPSRPFPSLPFPSLPFPFWNKFRLKTLHFSLFFDQLKDQWTTFIGDMNL